MSKATQPKTSDFLSNFDFQKLIAPCTSERFFEEYFEKKILLIKRENRDYYDGLLDLGDLDNIFFHFPNDVSIENAGGIEGVKPSTSLALRQTSVQSILRDFDEGNSVVFHNLDQRHPPLSRLCALLENEHAWRYQASVHLHPLSSRFISPGVLNHNAFILQTSGPRSWRVNRTVNPALSENGMPAILQIDEQNHDAFVLEPGDFLYLPPGLTHDHAFSDATSVHITLRPHPPTWGEVVTFFVNRRVQIRPELGMSTPPGFVEQIAGDVAEPVKKLLLELSNLDLLDEARAFKNNKSNIYRGLFFGALERRLTTPELDVGAVYVKNHCLKIYTELTDEGEYRVHTPQKLVDLPIIFRPSIDFCLSGDEFAISDIPGMDSHEKIVLLQRLLAEGLIVKRG